MVKTRTLENSWSGALHNLRPGPIVWADYKHAFPNSEPPKCRVSVGLPQKKETHIWSTGTSRRFSGKPKAPSPSQSEPTGDRATEVCKEGLVDEVMVHCKEVGLKNHRARATRLCIMLLCIYPTACCLSSGKPKPQHPLSTSIPYLH